jgi:hypothetical protein
MRCVICEAGDTAPGTDTVTLQHVGRNPLDCAALRGLKPAPRYGAVKVAQSSDCALRSFRSAGLRGAADEIERLAILQSIVDEALDPAVAVEIDRDDRAVDRLLWWGRMMGRIRIYS